VHGEGRAHPLRVALARTEAAQARLRRRLTAR
jgi:hypothetical protein